MEYGTVAICALVFALAVAAPLGAKEKKQANSAPAEDPKHPSKKFMLEHLDASRIVWPNPPAIARIRYVGQFYGEKRDEQQAQRSRDGWTSYPEWRLVRLIPTRSCSINWYGLMASASTLKAVSMSIDEKVLAVFIYSFETEKVELIKNGVNARFKLPTGLAVDDADKLFVSDSELKHVLVFTKDHKVEASISDGMVRPAGLAVDNENRFLYVADSERDQVLVYDADAPYKFLRAIGKPSGKHDLVEPGSFSRPTNVAVDKDGNVYVADTFNNRIEIFDADGNFIREFGKPGDGPGYFARPKGVAVDSDGHIWVADAIQDRVQAFTPEGRLLIYIGGHGLLPGEFSVLAGLAFDNKNHFYASEQYPGRVQMFRYVTDEEAKVQKAERDKLAENKKTGTAPAAKQEAAGKARRD